MLNSLTEIEIMKSFDHQLLLPLVEDENICLPLPINVVSKYWNIELPMAEAIETAKQYVNSHFLSVACIHVCMRTHTRTHV